jgi:hypothetical protein
MEILMLNLILWGPIVTAMFVSAEILEKFKIKGDGK